ncbi:MAG: response regulator transcription factor [Planctomycetota bacterium]|jgi:DNA-binding response OmpR family regulator
MTRILIVEDEAPIREGLVERLAREGFRATGAATLADGMDRLEMRPDLVVLDRRLPDGEGLDLLRELRERGLRTPVIVLSARGQPEDRVEGLEDGADDYVTKPFNLRELVARVRAVLGRADSGAEREGSRLPFGAYELDLGARLLRQGRQEIELRKTEFDLLLYLARNPGRAIPRNELLDRVWGYDRYPTTRTVDYHVLALRKKVDPRHILTVHGVGYRFEP